MAGPISVALTVSTTGTDSDFVVKLIDVYPGDYPQPERPAPAPGQPAPRPPSNYVRMGGYQQLVRGEPFRAKFRRGFEKPVPMVPGEPTAITFDLPDVYHVFRRGHRVMVQVQSSWFPLVDRNPQRFMEIPKAKAADFQKATQRVYHGSHAYAAGGVGHAPSGPGAIDRAGGHRACQKQRRQQPGPAANAVQSAASDLSTDLLLTTAACSSPALDIAALLVEVRALAACPRRRGDLVSSRLDERTVADRSPSAGACVGPSTFPQVASRPDWGRVAAERECTHGEDPTLPCLEARAVAVSTIAAVPYDVVNTDEARALAAGNDLSFLHVSRAEIDLPADTNPYADIVYRTAAERFARHAAAHRRRGRARASTSTSCGWAPTSRPGWRRATRWTSTTRTS